MHPLLSLLLAIGTQVPGTTDEDPIPLRILYLGNDSARAEDYEKFLSTRFESVEALPHDEFTKDAADAADVVLLDWSQSEVMDRGGDALKTLASPIGPRDEWNKPLVLLGSAGLLIATPWQTLGGYG